MKNNFRANIYARVSSIKQQNDWDSLNNQIKACKNYCKQNNIKVISVYEEAFTWKKKSRPIFDKAIKDSIENKLSHFIIFDIDRFSREWYWVYSELKEDLNKNWVLLKDSKNIIWDTSIVVNNEHIDMAQYKWNNESSSEYAEVMMTTQANIEGKKILQRTISREIEIEQMWWHVRESNFWYINSKIKINGSKITIQKEHHIEWIFIKTMFKLKSENKLCDDEIVEQLNIIWYKSRRWKILNVKQMQMYFKNPIYAWVISSKWTWNKPIKASYEWLVNINTWNNVNSWKRKIVESKEWNIDIVDWKNQIDSPLIKRRHKFNLDFRFRNLVKSSLISDKLITWSYSNPWRDKPTWYYHPTRKRWTLGENIKKEIFEENIYKLFDEIEVNEVLKVIFKDRFEKIFEENKKDVLKNKDILVNRLKEIEKDKIFQEDSIPNVIHLPKIVESLNKKLVKLGEEELKIKDKIKKLENSNYLNNSWFKDFSFYILEHLTELLKESWNFEELNLIFKFVFKEIPTYDEIVNRTAPIYPIFALNTKKEPQLNWNSSLNLLWQSH